MTNEEYERGSGQQRVGIRAAVDAVRKAIFFAELLRTDAERASIAQETCQKAKGLAGERETVLDQVGRFERWTTAALPSDAEHCRQQIRRILLMVPSGSIEDGVLRQEWEKLQETAAGSPSPEDLDAKLTSFLYSARPALARAYEDILSKLERNLAVGAVLLGVTALFFGVKQFRALVVERWEHVLLALLILAPPPLLGTIAFLRRWGRAQRASLWWSWTTGDFFWRWAARYPTGYDVFARESRIGTRLVWAACFKALLFVLWLALCATVLYVAFDQHRILQTIGWSVCLAGFALVLATVVDLWDFIHPAPVRAIVVLQALALWAAYALSDFSTTLFVMLLAALSVVWLAVRKASNAHGAGKLLGWTFVLVSVVALIGMGWEERSDRDEAWDVEAPAGTSRERATSAIGSDEWPHPGPPDPTRPPPVVVVAASGGGSRAAVLTALVLQRLHATLLPSGESIGDHVQAISSVSGGSLATAAYLASRLGGPALGSIDKLVADDFLQPVLLGAIWPSISRGKVLENYWSEHLGLGRGLDEIKTSWRVGLKGKHALLPVPLFNSATLDGHPVVITPLEWRDYLSDLDKKAQEGQSLYRDIDSPTWVYYRSSVYSLESLVPGFSPNLAEAVRASANFPFGFPAVQVSTENALYYSLHKKDRTACVADPTTCPKERVRLTDGGVVSNSGMWTLFQLLSRHHVALEKRGVILIIVDASKMPESRGRTRTMDLLGSIFDRSPVAANMHVLMIQHLRTLLRKKLAVVEVAFTPSIANNIYTSWALDRTSLQTLTNDAHVALEQTSGALRDAWSRLSNDEEIKEVCVRLPID